MKTILCYGDSNTYGEIPGGGRYPYNVRWTGVLQKTLGADYLVIEEGCSGRTTVWDDPIEEDKNGKSYLPACLWSHRPIDLITIMLGTNDLKHRFSLTAYDIAEGASVLIKMVQKGEYGPDGVKTKILLISPPPIMEVDRFVDMFSGGREKSLKLAKEFKRVADEFCVEFLDTAPYLSVSQRDGIHYEAQSHEKFGKILAETVLRILQ